MANVTLAWNANPSADNVEDYKVFGANGTGVAIGSCVLLATVTGLTWTDTGLPNGQARTYYIEAVNAAGASSAEGPINITTAAASTVYLQSADNLSDVASPSTSRTNLGLGTSATMGAEWAPNFSAAGDVYIPAVVAMTIDQGNAAVGTGTLAYAKSTTASPGTFTTTTLPATLQAGAWLKVSASAVTGFVATHLKRTA